MAPLGHYRKKRRFDVTAEPRGKKARKGGDAYVIQKHAASRLHYDLRLELDGVMKSWAVTRGPSLVPAEKRLAVHTEDHPLEYNGFEGTIPKGEYGGGTVMIWDRGTWTPEGDPHFGYGKGHLSFHLHGEKLRGHWHLVRLRKRGGERQDPWLLMKADDDAEARDAGAKDILEEQPLSVASGRSMEEIADGKPVRKRPARGKVAAKAVWHSDKAAAPEKAAASQKSRSPARANTADKPRRKAARAALPDFIPPSLAETSAKPPDSANWIHEIKFDGYRIQARVEDGAAQLKTRKGLDWTKKFTPVAQALADLETDTALIDGEIVVEDDRGYSSFSALQDALKAGAAERMTFYAFDLLFRDGVDLRKEPLIARKDALTALLATLPNGAPVRLSEHFDDKGSVLLKHACDLGLEGIVSKLRDAPYRSGRSAEWLKSKCADRQEFVIAGYVPSSDDARAIGALIAAYYDDGVLQYAGRIGTGFTHSVARDLWKRLSPLETKTAPFPVPAEERRRGAKWVAPNLVAEIDFRGWTHGMRLRHPSFKGLRADKPAAEVVRERAAGASAVRPAAAAKKKPATKAGRGRPSTAGPKNAKTGGKARPEALQVGNEEVRLTSPDRVYWPDAGVTKHQLAAYYLAVWDWIAPHIVNRALSLVRGPEGIGGQLFFQKHASAGIDAKRLKLVPEDGDEIIALDSPDGLMALVQAGVLEIHVRGSTIRDLTKADRIVFDLDPDDAVAWTDVVKAAREVRERLAALKLQSFVKTTGGKGLHVVLPIRATAWNDVKTFANAFAQVMQSDDPQRYIAVANKKARKGKIFVDYLRNSREATAIAPYSTRARPGATVSAPIGWDELSRLKSPGSHTLATMPARLAKLRRDPWADIGKLKQSLPKASRSR